MSKPYWIALAGAAAVIAAAGLVKPTASRRAEGGVGLDVPEDEQTGYIGRQEGQGRKA